MRSTSLTFAAGVANGWIGSTPCGFASPYMSISRRGASHGSCASKESITSANGCRARAHSIQSIPFRKTFAAL